MLPVAGVQNDASRAVRAPVCVLRAVRAVRHRVRAGGGTGGRGPTTQQEGGLAAAYRWVTRDPVRTFTRQRACVCVPSYVCVRTFYSR